MEEMKNKTGMSAVQIMHWSVYQNAGRTKPLFYQTSVPTPRMVRARREGERNQWKITEEKKNAPKEEGIPMPRDTKGKKKNPKKGEKKEP